MACEQAIENKKVHCNIDARRPWKRDSFRVALLSAQMPRWQNQTAVELQFNNNEQQQQQEHNICPMPSVYIDRNGNRWMDGHGRDWLACNVTLYVRSRSSIIIGDDNYM